MKPAPFSYHRPRTVQEAVETLARLEDAKVLGGGQSLLPIMNMRLAEPAALLDVTAVPELRGSTETAEHVRYGAVTTHMMIEDELVPDGSRGLVPHAAHGIGYRAIRTRGTIAGSLAHSDSSAEWPTVMSALDATVVAASVRGERRIPVRELLQGFFTTALEEDEIIVAVEVPRLPDTSSWGLYKLARKPGEFAESLAVVLQHASGPEVWLGAARDTPVRLTEVERLVADGHEDIELRELAEAVGGQVELDGHARQLHAVAVSRALRLSTREMSPPRV